MAAITANPRAMAMAVTAMRPMAAMAIGLITITTALGNRRGITGTNNTLGPFFRIGRSGRNGDMTQRRDAAIAPALLTPASHSDDPKK